jgi:hypothetical protein
MTFPATALPVNSIPTSVAAATAAAVSQSVLSQSVAAPVAPRVPMAPQLSTNAPMPDLLRAITRADDSPPLREPVPVSRTGENSSASLRPTEMKTAEYSQPLPTTREEISPPVRKASDLSLRELDQQIRDQESALSDSDSIASSADDRRAGSSSDMDSDRGTTSSSQQVSGDIRLERIRDEHGGEMIEGTIKVFFEQGQKRAHLHVPFSPPLAGLPEVECEPTGDDPIRLKVAVRQPYGVRIEARRAEANEALRTEISFAAVYTPSSRG